MGISPCNGPEFSVLRRPISVEHAFSGATSRSEVAERLVLPVSPRGKTEVKCIDRVPDLGRTAFTIEAGSKFGKHQGNSVICRVFQPLEDLLLVEFAALF